MEHPYTCDTLPLDNPKTHLHLALLYMTWGLIWDSKNKREGIPEFKQEGEILQLLEKREIRIEVSLLSGTIGN